MPIEVRANADVGMVLDTVFVESFTDGMLRPDDTMLGPVRVGGHIIANTAPGCWGPMITPALRGGHEVTQPVAVEGAEIGDAVAIRIKRHWPGRDSVRDLRRGSVALRRHQRVHNNCPSSMARSDSDNKRKGVPS